jgi:hypothetical protein
MTNSSMSFYVVPLPILNDVARNIHASFKFDFEDLNCSPCGTTVCRDLIYAPSAYVIRT